MVDSTRRLNEQSTHEEIVRAVNAVTFADAGATGYGRQIKSRNDLADWLIDVDNANAGGQHANFGGVLTVTDAAVTVVGAVPLVASGALGVVGATNMTTLSTSGLATLQSASVTTTLSTGGLATLSSLSVTNNATVGGTLGVTGASTFTGATEVNNTLTAQLLAVDGTGNVLDLTGTSQTQTTVGAAGGASALPATPTGYMKVRVGGTSRVVAYYAAS